MQRSFVRCRVRGLADKRHYYFDVIGGALPTAEIFVEKNSRYFAASTFGYSVTNVSAPKRFALARLFVAAFACLFAAHSMAATSSSALPAMPETVPVSPPQTTIHAASQSNAISTPQGNGSAANNSNNNSDNNNGNSANGQSRRPAWTLANPSQGQGRAPARARPHATSEVIAIALDIDAEVGDELTFPLPGSEETLVGVVSRCSDLARRRQC